MEQLTGRGRAGRVLRYRADIYPLVLSAIVLTCQVGVLLQRPSIGTTCAIAGALLLPQIALATALHNHAHLPMFRNTWLNRLIEQILFLQTGMFASKFRIHHNIGHHCYYGDAAKDPSRWVYRDGRTMPRLAYIAHYYFTYNYYVWTIGKAHKQLLNSCVVQTIVAWASFAGLVWVAPAQALILFGVPILLVWLTFICLTYDDHVELHDGGTFTGSHSKTHRGLNWLVFNNGYHLAHHAKPGVHWSELRVYHDSIRDQIRVNDPITVFNRLFA